MTGESVARTDAALPRREKDGMAPLAESSAGTAGGGGAPSESAGAGSTSAGARPPLKNGKRRRLGAATTCLTVLADDFDAACAHES
jgi:hypothetical protein